MKVFSKYRKIDVELSTSSEYIVPYDGIYTIFMWRHDGATGGLGLTCNGYSLYHYYRSDSIDSILMFSCYLNKNDRLKKVIDTSGGTKQVTVPCCWTEE